MEGVSAGGTPWALSTIPPTDTLACEMEFRSQSRVQMEFGHERDDGLESAPLSLFGLKENSWHAAVA